MKSFFLPPIAYYLLPSFCFLLDKFIDTHLFQRQALLGCHFINEFCGLNSTSESVYEILVADDF